MKGGSLMYYKYKPQRGSLRDSLVEAAIFCTESQMKAAVAKSYNEVFAQELFTPQNVEINQTYTFDDPRIGLTNCHQVLLTVNGTSCAVGIVSIVDNPTL